MRTGDLLGLRWEDISFQERYIFVRHSIRKGELNATKTGKERFVPILDATLPYLKNQFHITGLMDELTAEDLDQLELRLRGVTKNYKQFIITFNSVSAQHWLKKRFFDSYNDNVFTLKSTYLDNPFIDPEYKETFKRLK